ncbi:hypothetical protein B0H14DRAFT_2631517 [Mycena olivaceomarginata]|nr:hypothetical protein B0H14DRAFT_2631517 [Mycena olivaceomarginata]
MSRQCLLLPPIIILAFLSSQLIKSKGVQNLDQQIFLPQQRHKLGLKFDSGLKPIPAPVQPDALQQINEEHNPRNNLTIKFFVLSLSLLEHVWHFGGVLWSNGKEWSVDLKVWVNVPSGHSNIQYIHLIHDFLVEYGPIDEELKRVLAHERLWSVAAWLLADQFLGDAARILLCSFYELPLRLSKMQAVDIRSQSEGTPLYVHFVPSFGNGLDLSPAVSDATNYMLLKNPGGTGSWTLAVVQLL